MCHALFVFMKKKSRGRGVEGEGSYSGTRKYNEDLAKSVKEGRAEALARKAIRDAENGEADELKRAEAVGKSRRRDTGLSRRSRSSGRTGRPSKRARRPSA